MRTPEEWFEIERKASEHLELITEVARLNGEVERLREENERQKALLAVGPWDAWRNAEAEVRRLRGAILMLREQLEDLDDRAWTPDERDARAILIALLVKGEK